MFYRTIAFEQDQFIKIISYIMTSTTWWSHTSFYGKYKPLSNQEDCTSKVSVINTSCADMALLAWIPPWLSIRHLTFKQRIYRYCVVYHCIFVATALYIYFLLYFFYIFLLYFFYLVLITDLWIFVKWKNLLWLDQILLNS